MALRSCDPVTTPHSTISEDAGVMEVTVFSWLTHAVICIAVQVDTNKDRVVSFSEFMESVNSNAFAQNEQWEVRGQLTSAAVF